MHRKWIFCTLCSARMTMDSSKTTRVPWWSKLDSYRAKRYVYKNLRWTEKPKNRKNRKTVKPKNHFVLAFSIIFWEFFMIFFKTPFYSVAMFGPKFFENAEMCHENWNQTEPKTEPKIIRFIRHSNNSHLYWSWKLRTNHVLLKTTLILLK